MKNLILMSDSYKYSHWNQYPPETQFVSSYISARKAYTPETVFFGLQAYIKEYLQDSPIIKYDIDEAEMIIRSHGEPFNRSGWENLVNVHGGYLPIQIEAVEEGTVMSPGNVQVQIKNTDPNYYWLPSFLETALLRAVWYPSSVATLSREMKKVIANGLKRTSDIPVEEQIQFKLHDFGARGASSHETAMLGGMAHLVNFSGTDTVEALIGASRYYEEAMAGFSIPASEHSTIIAWGKNREKEAYQNMLDVYSGQGKLLACVSDSYDIYNAVQNLWGLELKEAVKNNGGTLIIRPDSGDPLEVPATVIEILMDRFGYTVNSKGFRVLPSFIRVIQGDGISRESLPKIIDVLIEKGISIDNIAFGMGGGLLQAHNRDDLSYAMKASAIVYKGSPEWVGIHKSPIHSKEKASLSGRFGVIRDEASGVIQTVSEESARGRNLLRTVFANGELNMTSNLKMVRMNAALR